MKKVVRGLTVLAEDSEPQLLINAQRSENR